LAQITACEWVYLTSGPGDREPEWKVTSFAREVGMSDSTSQHGAGTSGSSSPPQVDVSLIEDPHVRRSVRAVVQQNHIMEMRLRQQQQEIEAQERVIVGVNAFEEGNQDSEIDILRIGNEPEARQRQRLAELRQKRDDARVQKSLEQLRQAAREHKNVVEPMLECVRSYCTLYEIRHALEEVHGAYKEPIFF